VFVLSEIVQSERWLGRGMGIRKHVTTSSVVAPVLGLEIDAKLVIRTYVHTFASFRLRNHLGHITR